MQQTDLPSCGTHLDCENHRNELTLYCKTCNSFLCAKCVTSTDTDHNLCDIGNVVSQEKEVAITLITELKSKIKILVALKERIKCDFAGKVETVAGKSLTSIQETFRDLKDFVEYNQQIKQTEVEDSEQLEQMQTDVFINSADLVLKQQTLLCAEIENLMKENHDIKFHLCYKTLKLDVESQGSIPDEPLWNKIAQFNSKALFEGILDFINSKWDERLCENCVKYRRRIDQITKENKEGEERLKRLRTEKEKRLKNTNELKKNARSELHKTQNQLELAKERCQRVQNETRQMEREIQSLKKEIELSKKEDEKLYRFPPKPAEQMPSSQVCSYATVSHQINTDFQLYRFPPKPAEQMPSTQVCSYATVSHQINTDFQMPSSQVCSYATVSHQINTDFQNNSFEDFQRLLRMGPKQVVKCDIDTADHIIENFSKILYDLTVQPGNVEDAMKPVVHMLRHCREDCLINIIVEMLFEQSVTEPNFRYSGAKSVQYLSVQLLDIPEYANFSAHFLTRCKEEYVKKEELISNPETEGRLCEFTLFMGELFLHLEVKKGAAGTEKKAVLRFIIKDLLCLLLEQPTDENVKCIAQLLKMAGAVIEDTAYLNRHDEGNYGDIFAYLLKLSSSSYLNKTSRKMISSVFELKDSNWGRISAASSQSTDLLPCTMNYDPYEPVFYNSQGKCITREEAELISRTEEEAAEEYARWKSGELYDGQYLGPSSYDFNKEYDRYQQPDNYDEYNIDEEMEEAYEEFLKTLY